MNLKVKSFEEAREIIQLRLPDSMQQNHVSLIVVVLSPYWNCGAI